MLLCIFFSLVFNTSSWTDEQYPKYPGSSVNNTNQTECWYRGWNEPEYPYERKESWWHVFAAKLAFVLAFQVYTFSYHTYNKG